MRSEARHISYSFYFLYILLVLLSFLDFAPPILTQFGLSDIIFPLSEKQLGQVWPYFSLLFALLLLLLGLRFPTRRKNLRSAYFLSLTSFLFIFESFGLFSRHPLYSFLRIWNYGAELFLQDSFARAVSQGDFLPIAIFAFWGPALLILILPADRFPLLHWLTCFILLMFSMMHIGAGLFFRLYNAGLVSAIILLPVMIYHMYHLLQLSDGLQTISLALLALFYVLLLCSLVLIPNSGLFFQSISSGQSDAVYLSSLQVILGIKMLNYTMFFLWFTFPLLFLFLFPHSK
ncbi:hypothetical protein P0082_11060 [Candidatus Haliotispira prima]|uniref:Uncharacterized protein n=1 Tax=Candidatus Haliotispira prima TaxID=3034016 RepID=A0ABY8MGB6_9SPIO|nr:hypothetical protein P0082_11060 [Candidatus Haliotispira prima]